MTENKLEFLKNAFPNYKVYISENGTQATIFNPFYNENVILEYFEEDDYTPFIAHFSFQHRHLNDEKNVVDWINEIVEEKRFAIEFFKNEQNKFGGDIEATELADISYPKLERLTGYYGATKLYEIADSFKIRGWNKDSNFDAVFVFKKDGTIIIQKHIVV